MTSDVLSGGRQQDVMSTSTDVLDSLLPLLQPAGRELHLNAAIVEVSEPAQLVELAADPSIRRFLLARLSGTVALVDPGHAGEIEAALLAAGHTPKVLTGDGE